MDDFLELIANLSGGKVQKKILKGKEYLVAPLTMIVPGVLDGSLGPGFYAEAEVKKNPAIWNGVPIVYTHPFVNDKPASARVPEVFEKFGLGYVYNSKFKDGKLVAEGWFDPEAVAQVEPRVLNKLLASQPFELSTGLSAERDLTPGIFNGKSYDFSVKNFHPDHLAVLLDEPGACSINDGCGVLNQARKEAVASWVNRFGVESMLGLEEVIQNSMAHDELREKLQALVSARFGEDELTGNKRYVWVQSVNDKTLIYADDSTGNLMQIGYKTDLRSDTVELSGSPVQVRRKVTYETVTNSPGSHGDNEMALTKEERKNLVDQLIANCSCGDSDRQTLENLSDDGLKAVVNMAKPVPAAFTKGKGKAKPADEEEEEEEEEEEPVMNKKKRRQLTEAEFMSMAPESVKAVLNRAHQEENRKRSEIINELTAHISDDTLKTQTATVLNAKSIEELSMLKGLVATHKTHEITNESSTPFFPSFAPAPGLTNSAASRFDKTDVLAPVLDE